MDINTIREIISTGYSDEITESLILREFSKDENVIPKILEIIDFERKAKKELIEDMNLELSRLHVIYEDSSVGGRTKEERQNFVKENITKFYTKWRGVVGHCFNSKIGKDVDK